jgi:putative ABC transport system permease protein
MWLDLRYALRMMTKSVGLTAVLAVTLALGIGASTTIFSVVNSVVLKPLPYEQPDRLVRVYSEFRGMGLERFWISPPEFDDLEKACRSCEAVGAWAQGTASLAGGDRPVRIQAAYVTHQVLPILGVKPILGRWFDKAEDRAMDPKLGALAYEDTVILLSYGVWQRAFGGDPSVVGRKITLDAMPVTVIGVMPEGFDFLDRQEAWVPLNWDFQKMNRGGHGLNVIAKLKEGVGIEALRDELTALGAGWMKLMGPNRHSLTVDNPYDLRAHPLVAFPFHDDLVGNLSTTLWLLQAAVLLVLMIAIVNVANLLLARSETRTREVAVRHALGASRRRLLRQFLTESILLGAIGGGLGILVAVWAVDGVTELIPKSAPRANEIALDAKAVVFAVACSFAAAMLFGMAPIFHAKKSDLHSALKEGGPRMTGSRARLRIRRALVIAEISLAVLLVIGCTVMVRSFLKLQQVDLGFDPQNVLTLELELPQKRYPGTTADVFWHRLDEKLHALPGVKNATLMRGLPPSRPINANDINFPNRTHKPDELPWNVDYWQGVGDNWVETLGVKVVKGRAFTRGDTAESPRVVMVNEAFVKRFFPGEDPIGKQVEIYEMRPPRPKIYQTIVGVVGDMKQAGIDKPSGTEVYVPTWQLTSLDDPPDATRIMWIVVRTDGDPELMGPAVTRAIADLDPTLPISSMRPMNDVMWEAVARPRFLTFLLTSFAGLALLLAAVGIYGVMAHTVAQRTHEIGLRVALGAQPSHVRKMVLKQAGVLVAIGVVTGLAVTLLIQLLLGGKLQSVFYGAELAQPILLVAVAVTVTLTALLATWIPARRATRVEPTVALRSE